MDTPALDQLARHPKTPEWARALLTSPPSPAVHVSVHTIDLSYLEFLKEQIELGARGPEWNEILRARLQAYRSTVGQPLVRIRVLGDGLTFIGHVRVADLQVVHTELL
jgi:hypothetical protein